MHSHAGSDDICNGIISAHLVKMDMMRSMNHLFGLCDPVKYPLCLRNYCRWCICLMHNRKNFSKRAMGRTGMGVDLYCSNTAPVNGLYTRLMDYRTHYSYDLFFVCTKAKEGSTYHVSCSAVKGVKYEKTHGSYTFKSRRI